MEAAVDVVGRAGREALAVRPCGPEVEFGLSGAEAATQARLGRVVVPVADFGGPATVVAASRDHVDHAADRVGAIQRGTRAFHDLDPLDVGGVDALQRREPDRARVDPHAIHQHQRVIAVGAAHEHGRGLPRPAVAAELEPRVEAQDVSRVGGTAALDRVAVDHQDRDQHFLQRNRHARRGDDDLLFGQDRVSRQRQRRQCGGTGRDENESTHEHPTPLARPQGQNCCPAAGWGGSGERAWARIPAARPPRGWSRPAGRSPGSRVDHIGSRLHPLPAHCAVGAGMSGRCGLDSTTVAGAAPDSDRLPVLPATCPGSPVGACTVGVGGVGVKILWPCGNYVYTRA